VKYTDRQDGEWFKVDAATKLMCCDCGLVHYVRFKRMKGKLFMQCKRNARATANARRKKK